MSKTMLPEHPPPGFKLNFIQGTVIPLPHANVPVAMLKFVGAAASYDVFEILRSRDAKFLRFFSCFPFNYGAGLEFMNFYAVP